jgi:hypothetical protein
MKLKILTGKSFTITSEYQEELDVIEKAMNIQNDVAEEIYDDYYDTYERVYGTYDTVRDIRSDYAYAKKEAKKELANARSIGKTNKLLK